MPLLPKLLSGHAAVGRVLNIYAENYSDIKANPVGPAASLVHGLISVLKPIASWFAIDGI